MLGYLHLDLKPDNILVDMKKGGKICLIDFGISEKYVNNHGEILPAKPLVNI